LRPLEGKCSSRCLCLCSPKSQIPWGVQNPSISLAVLHCRCAKVCKSFPSISPCCPALQVCKSLYPKMKRIASDNPDVLWAKLNGTDATLVPIFQAMGIKKVGGDRSCKGGCIRVVRSWRGLHKPCPPPSLAVCGMACHTGQVRGWPSVPS